MREMTPDELKQVGIEILKFIDIVCKENGIRYFILFGTLLGAVRHQGYIPWDDDIDIGMIREDYNRFIEVMKEQSKYKLISMETDPDYYFSFARVSDFNTQLKLHTMREIHDIGVFVDVFPIDNAPDETEIASYFEKFYELRHKVWITIPSTAKYCDHSLHTMIRMVKRFPQRIMYGVSNFDLYRKELIDHMIQYNMIPTEKYVIAETPYRERAIFDKDIFKGVIELSFERNRFFAPIGYEKFLTGVYGDYMKLPPKEKQVTHHHFTAYWKD